MSQRNTFVLISAVACALLLIGSGIFYFPFQISDDTQHNLDGTVSEENTETVLGETTNTATGPITVFTPRANERVGSPISISGEIALPQTSMYYRLKDADGVVLASGYIQNSQQTSQATNTFGGSLAYTASVGGKGTIEVFVLSQNNAQELFTVSVPVFYTENFRPLTNE